MADSHTQKQVNIRVPERTKKEWKRAKEEQYGSLKYLITTAVGKELSDRYIDRETIPSSDQGEVDLSEVTEQLEDLSNGLKAITSRIDDIEGADTVEVDEDHLASVGMHAQDALPLCVDEDELRQMELTGLESGEQIPKITGKADHVAQYIQEPVEVVRQALIYVENQTTAPVDSTLQDGVRRWFVRQ